MDVKEEKSPVYHVKAVPVEKVCANITIRTWWHLPR